MHRELEARGGNPHSSVIAGPSPNQGPSQAPPSIGHGPSNLFGGIMAGQVAPGLAPPPPTEQHLPPQHQMSQPPPGPPTLQGPPPGPPTLQGPPPPPPQQATFQGSYSQGPVPNGYSQGPQSTNSPGPGKGRPLNRGPGGPATPQLNQQIPYPDPRAVASPQVGHLASQHPPSYRAGVGNALADLELDRLLGHQKKEGQDWFAIFNPEVPRVLDVDLVHTLQHESVVCCVRFSHCGKFVATGCNRSAQIFNISNGQKICILQDESVDSVGDLYIRSVCFSPDGHYLATGAEDKLIRVSGPIIRLILKC